MKNLWHLDPDLTFLNHGSFGACPKDILVVQDQYRQQLEKSPIHFMLRQLPQLLNENREALAELLHCQAKDLCFITNATQGVQTAVNHLNLQAGDEIVYSSHIYGACKNQLLELSQQKKIILREAHYEMIGCSPQTIIDAFCAQFNRKTKAFLIDHISSPTALIHPVQALCQIAREKGIISIVDGAHAPAHIPLFLDEINADFYTGNCHKWLCTPKGCAFLWVHPLHQKTLLPTVISHGYLAPIDQRMHQMFDWTGTQDFTPYLCIKDSIAWLNQQHPQGIEGLMQKHHQLMLLGRDLLVQTLNPLSGPPVGDEMLGAMASIPLADEKEIIPIAFAQPLPLQSKLFELGIEIPVIPWRQRPQRLIRISAFSYNHIGEYQHLCDVLKQLRDQDIL
jgi:isopenicillin-N epimerase